MKTDWDIALGAHSAGDWAQAYRICSRITAAQPHHIDALQLMGAIALKVGKPREAAKLFAYALGLAPQEYSLWANAGSAWHALGDHAQALEHYDQAITRAPAHAANWYNRANTLKALGRHEEAFQSFDRCLALDPGYAPAHYNRANLLFSLGQAAEAIPSFDRAIELRPGDAQAHKNRAFAKLMTGEFRTGWDDYEWRWQTEPMNRDWIDRGCPQWTGSQSIAGKTVLIHAEQGLGDTLQFCRLGAAVKAAGAARVVLEVQKPLRSLLSTLSGVDEVVVRGQSAAPCDFHSPLMSLPRALRLTVDRIPASVPYIQADRARVDHWHHQLPRDAFNIGICWEGSAKGKEVGKGIPLDNFRALLQHPQVRLYSLQKFDGSSEAAADQATWLTSFGPGFDQEAPFMDTAGVMCGLDLVVSTDTSVAHLAGALGIPVWVALPHVADWRWFQGRADTPWYPTMRLFRQAQPGDWVSCFTQINQELRSRLQTSRCSGANPAHARSMAIS